MTNVSTFLRVSCSQLASRPRPVYIEPLGNDYWLFPGDEFEFVASSDEPAPFFELVEDDEATQIHLERRGDDFAVHHNGQPIESGYQRARFAGNVSRALNIVGRGVVVVSDKPWLMNFAAGDQLRLVIPAIKTLSARVVQLEHMNTGYVVVENPWGLFLGKLEIDPAEILPGSPIYCLEPLSA